MGTTSYDSGLKSMVEMLRDLESCMQGGQLDLIVLNGKETQGISSGWAVDFLRYLLIVIAILWRMAEANDKLIRRLDDLERQRKTDDRT